MNKDKVVRYAMYKSYNTLYGQSFESYGIKGKTVSFDDVSTDRNKVVEMVERMNEQQLEECQFYYFIEDELYR